jgi:cullin 3
MLQLGTELVLDQEKVKDPVLFVKQLLAMRDEYDSIVEVAFGGEKKAAKALKEAFEGFINADSKCASFLVLYMDELLKSGLKGSSEAEVDAQLEKVLVIFRYLQDKDVFENFYKQYLSKRLLGGKSMSEDSERCMIAKLKSECGYHFTSKLEGMFTDLHMSKETMEQFHAAQAEAFAHDGGGASSSAAAASPVAVARRAPEVELEVKVLTAAHWPSSNSVAAQCSLPPEVATAHAAFCAFYSAKHTGRKLAWQTALGTADLKARFGSSRHELNVSTYQMVLLMKFNGRGNETHSLEALSELGIPPLELRRHLVSLCTPKHKILKKASKGKGIEAGDSFTFNSEYSSKLKRVKVPLVSAKETGGGGLDDPEGIPAGVEEDRRHLVEAAIVRIMKARKVLQHNELIAEVTRQLQPRFSAAPAFVKKRVESLLEREYLERNPDDRRVYTYLA